MKRLNLMTYLLVATMAGASFGQSQGLTPEKIKSMLDTIPNKGKEVGTRRAMLNMLIKEKTPELVPICKKMLLDNTEDQKLREASVAALSAVSNPDALTAIRESFDKEFYDEKEKAKELNVPVDNVRINKPLVAVLIPEMSKTKDPLMVFTLYPAMFSGDKGIRTAAINAIGDIGGVEALYPLLSCLEVKRIETRMDIARNVGKVMIDQAISPLVGFLGEENEDIRNTGLEALKLRDKEKVKKIAEIIIGKEMNKDRKERMQKGLDTVLKWRKK